MITINHENEIKINCDTDSRMIIHTKDDGYYVEIVEKTDVQTTTSLIDQLKSVNNIEVEETVEYGDGTQDTRTVPAINMREFLKANNLT